MEPIYLHLTSVHVPVVGVGFTLFVLIYALARRSAEVARVGMWMAVGVALFTVVAYQSGESAEDAAEELPGVTDAWIEPHEEIAETALGVTIAAGVVALAGLVFSWRRRGRVPSWVTGVVLVPVLASAVLLIWTAQRGGQIRHTEIRKLDPPPAAAH